MSISSRSDSHRRGDAPWSGHGRTILPQPLSSAYLPTHTPASSILTPTASTFEQCDGFTLDQSPRERCCKTEDQPAAFVASSRDSQVPLLPQGLKDEREDDFMAESTAPRLESTSSPHESRFPTQTRFREELCDGDEPREQSYRSNGCYSRQGPRGRWCGLFALSIWVLSIFSTIGSFIWLIAAIYQPRWGKTISSNGALSPSTASLVTALLAKLIETSFVAVFVVFVGQVLTKRAFGRKSRGTTLAEISMRNWVIQPGLIITNLVALRHALFTFLGLLCLVATLTGVLYTTASDALVSPKLKFGRWEQTVLQSSATASYANLEFIRSTCATPISHYADAESNNSCLEVAFSGASYHNFQSFLSTWHDFGGGASNSTQMMLDRPPATAILFDNTTMTGAWIEQTGNLPEQNFIKHGRIVNNVTLAMPHPGVYLAATDPINNILQPSDLSGVGEYEIRASSVSPTVNVLCANMALKELEPLVYTAWPNAKVNTTDIPNQTVAWPKWVHDIPRASDSEWLNRTVVDDVFRWGKGYGRRPPVFPMLPMDFNLIVNVSVYESDALYLLAKSNAISNYTLCELRSWLSPNCSTRFSISGTHGAHMSAYCEDPNDPVSYLRSVPGAPSNHTSTDWRWLADEWQLSLYLNSGMSNANASRDRILTEMILADPRLPSSVPSMAEALAALVSSTLVFGSLNSPLVHYWDQVTPSVSAPGVLQQFNASIMKQEYTSSFTNNWQSAFYVVLVVVFLLNLLCLCYFVLELKGRPLTDFTDPANLFALAINSPPSRTLRGSCGGGPADRDLVMPWRVGYDKEENHYYFVEKGQEARIERRPRVKRKGRMAGAGAVRSPTADLMVDDGKEMERGLEPTSRSYQRLSNGRSWL